ncbi:MAG: lipopolysaccharide transport periplasmic protein LptA [Sideroxydans sp.]|nr:lipopolysaccharide transport periplasmic protein LptA [Sideroxydans sp.]
MTPFNKYAVLLSSALLLCNSAQAERADSEKPLHLEADRMKLDDAKHINLFEGHVRLSQGTLLILADKVVVVEDAQGFQRLTAHGSPASFKQRNEGTNAYTEGYGARIEYDTRADSVDFFEQARVKRDQDEITGNHISYNSKLEIFEASAKPNDAKNTATKQDRVRAVIQPKNKRPVTSDSTPATLMPSPSLTAQP